MRTKHIPSQLLAIFVVSWLVAACGGKVDRPPVSTTSRPPRPATTTVPQQTIMPERDVLVVEERDDDLMVMERDDPLGILELKLDVINARQPLADIGFGYDSAALSANARSTLGEHADTLKTYRSMTILIEGHSDERGTVEYNLALGERRANAVYNYLVSLGLNASRLKTISYGKEFPLDLGHNEVAWRRNRRGHFEFTAK